MSEKFVLTVECLDDHFGYVNDALWKIVDDGRLWELVEDAVIAEGGEDNECGGGVEYVGKLRDFQATERNAIARLKDVVESNWIGQLSVPDYDAFDQAIAKATAFLRSIK